MRFEVWLMKDREKVSLEFQCETEQEALDFRFEEYNDAENLAKYGNPEDKYRLHIIDNEVEAAAAKFRAASQSSAPGGQTPTLAKGA